MTDYEYQAFGLSISSDIPVLELAGSVRARGEPAQVRVAAEAADATAGFDRFDPGYTVADDNRIVFRIEDLVCYEITRGTHIAVCPVNGANPAAISVYLLGSVFGALLHQRGLLPLHASAVVDGDAAVAFSGPIGAGKSTMAAALLQRGRRILADDVLALHPAADGPFLAFPGVPHIKVCPDVLAGLTLGNADHWPINQVSEKHHIPNPGPVPGNGLRLRRIYFLEPADHPQELVIEELSAFDGLQFLRANSYRDGLIALLGLESRFLEMAATLLRRIDCYRLRRPRDFAAMPTMLDALERHLDE